MMQATNKNDGNPIEMIQLKVKQLDKNVKLWLKKQPAAVEVALVTAGSAVQGGAIGALMGTFSGDVTSAMPTPPPGLNPEAAASLQQAKAFAGGPMMQARNFAVMTGVNAGITCAMKRARGGKEDLQTSAVAAFGSGAVFSAVSGMGGPNVLGNALTTGFFFALVQGGLYQVGKKFAKTPTEDKDYLRGKNMLQKLDLQKYEKNLRKGMLTDSTLHLVNDSALRDVQIPPGPRLLILDYLKKSDDATRSST
ncbi:hypothetical protein M758_5G107900 [Ceratodon purpureus]|uniref:SAM domain-containing protein n=1 Tax=Ceratodon purpureus TaxID=3225 RepID=A0A8T0I1G2_CERPU|nr:hypothetical protein KC19_5G121700 [Ceratodon purpureus]KAG0616352.1 hypothetical protein M758_5G107900 [Ceratodon purpureus]